MNPPINLSELETIINSLLAEGKCACHIINPHKTRILMWKQVAKGITTYHLRIGIQKFVSSQQQDRNGETYWRYYPYELNSGPLEPTNLTPTNPSQSSEYGKSNPEPAVNSVTV